MKGVTALGLETWPQGSSLAARNRGFPGPAAAGMHCSAMPRTAVSVKGQVGRGSRVETVRNKCLMVWSLHSLGHCSVTPEPLA